MKSKRALRISKRPNVVKRKRFKRNPESGAHSTSAANALFEDALGGVAGYAAARLACRTAYATTIKKWPKAAPFAGITASASVVAGVWFLGKYWKTARPYSDAAMIGAVIATIQQIVQTFVPALGWMISDIRPDQYPAQPVLKPVEPDAMPDIDEPLPEDAYGTPGWSGPATESTAADDRAQTPPIWGGGGDRSPPPPATSNYVPDAVGGDEDDLAGGIFGAGSDG